MWDTGVGCWLAWGAREKKREIWLRDSASAMQFSLPGRCLRATLKLCCAAIKNSFLSSSIIPGCLEDWLLHACTMGRLSQLNLIRRPSRRWPHVRAAATMAKSSCH